MAVFPLARRMTGTKEVLINTGGTIKQYHLTRRVIGESKSDNKCEAHDHKYNKHSINNSY